MSGEGERRGEVTWGEWGGEEEGGSDLGLVDLEITYKTFLVCAVTYCTPQLPCLCVAVSVYIHVWSCGIVTFQMLAEAVDEEDLLGDVKVSDCCPVKRRGGGCTCDVFSLCSLLQEERVIQDLSKLSREDKRAVRS